MLQGRQEASDGGRARNATALVLAGGKSLGAFEGGAYCALHDAGIRPSWVIGASIGAVNGAIIAGNPEEERTGALERFWSRAAVPSPIWAGELGPWQEFARRWTAQFQAMMLGSPAVFSPNPAAPAGFAWPAPVGAMGMYDLTPLRRSLEEFVDFDRVNGGDLRLTVVAVDLETGEEVLFDTERHRLGPEHIMASGAMLVDFPPVEIGSRLFVDGGLRSNWPADVLCQEAREDTTCFAIDLFSARGRRCNNIPEAFMRRHELLMVATAFQILKAHQHEEGLRDALKTVLKLVPENLRNRTEIKNALQLANRPAVDIRRVAWSSGDEIGLNTYDWSDRTLSLRWRAGELAAADCLRELASSEASVGSD